MSYFDNVNNEPLNKYKRDFKNEFFYRCVLLPIDWVSFKFHAISLSFDSSSKTVKLKPLQIAYKFDDFWWTIKR
jgi:hypothetical protein